MIDQQINKAGQEGRNPAGIGRTAPSRVKGSTPAPVNGDWQADPGIINRMRDYRDWWNIPARRAPGTSGTSGTKRG